MANSPDTKWRSVALVLVGLLAGQILMGAAGAHMTSFKHLKRKHFFTKSQAHARFLTATEADARLKTRWALVELDVSRVRILQQTGGFSVTDGGTGWAHINVGEDASNKGIQVTPQVDGNEVNALVCGGGVCGLGSDHIYVSVLNSGGSFEAGKVWLSLLPG